MNSVVEIKEFYESLMFENYNIFDFSNPMRDVPTRTSYHIKKIEEDKILKELFKIRLILKPELTDVAMRKLSKDESEYWTLKMLNAINQSMFLSIVVSKHFISVYEFCACPHMGAVDLSTEDMAERFHVPVLGYDRSIEKNFCADPGNIEYFMVLGTGKGINQRYVRRKDPEQVDNMDISVFCECYDLLHRKAEVEEIFQKEPDDVFDGIAGLLGVNTWFPKDLKNYKLEKSRKNKRLYRQVQ